LEPGKTKMKIALITINRSANYGAVLQAYATQKVLSQYGDVKIIDYHNKHLAHHLDLIRFSPDVHGILKFLHDMLRFPFRWIAVSRFRKFFDQYLKLTRRYTEDQLYRGEAGVFDVYVCGSDQIWNPDIVTENARIDPIFFLDFAPKDSEKISYASSIGHHHFSPSEQIEVKKYLENFSMVSTREADGLEKLKGLYRSGHIHHVLDPTMLLSKKDWKEHFDLHENLSNEKYILVYSVPRTELIREVINYVSKITGYRIVTIDQMLFPVGKTDKHIRTAGPVEFVDAFLNATFVITDSFHGTCFAVNFEKPFLSISAGKRSTRIRSLLAQLDLSSRLISSSHDLTEALIELDYEKPSVELNKNRQRCLNLLEKAFSV